MCQNFLLEYGGYTPAQCLQGHNPRGLFDHSSDSTLAIDGARESTPDIFETYLRLRMMAKSAVQKAVLEQRIAEANNTKVQILSDVAKLRPLQDVVDLYRTPDRKDQSGWRRPCDLLDINMKENVAIVKHQPMPYIVPLRHIRPHRARSYLVTLSCPPPHLLTEGEGKWQANPHDDLYSSLHHMLDIVDGQQPSSVVPTGTVHDMNEMRVASPNDFEVNSPKKFQLVSRICESLLQIAAPRTIRCGTQLHDISTYHGIGKGIISLWLRRNRLNYMVRQVDLAHTLQVATI
eukprot:5118829-Pyramimonas_sp.AAC.1